MQMILACTHASINECMYVHCMMIKQNHNKLNNKKYNFNVVFARTPQSGFIKKSDNEETTNKKETLDDLYDFYC